MHKLIIPKVLSVIVQTDVIIISQKKLAHETLIIFEKTSHTCLMYLLLQAIDKDIKLTLFWL